MSWVYNQTDTVIPLFYHGFPMYDELFFFFFANFFSETRPWSRNAQIR